MALATSRRARKGLILETARRILHESNLVAVASVTRSDVPSLTRARIEFRSADFGFKKLPNRLCSLALEGTERAFMRGLFRGDTYVLYPSAQLDDAALLAQKLLTAMKTQDHVVLIGGALDDVPLYASDFEPLAKMASQEALRAEVARTLRAPLLATATALRSPSLRAARSLAAPPLTVARALDAQRRRREEAADEEDDEAA